MAWWNRKKKKPPEDKGKIFLKPEERGAAEGLAEKTGAEIVIPETGETYQKKRGWGGGGASGTGGGALSQVPELSAEEEIGKSPITTTVVGQATLQPGTRVAQIETPTTLQPSAVRATPDTPIYRRGVYDWDGSTWQEKTKHLFKSYLSPDIYRETMRTFVGSKEDTPSIIGAGSVFFAPLQVLSLKKKEDIEYNIPWRGSMGGKDFTDVPIGFGTTTGFEKVEELSITRPDLFVPEKIQAGRIGEKIGGTISKEYEPQVSELELEYQKKVDTGKMKLGEAQIALTAEVEKLNIKAQVELDERYSSAWKDYSSKTKGEREWLERMGDYAYDIPKIATTSALIGASIVSPVLGGALIGTSGTITTMEGIAEKSPLKIGVGLTTMGLGFYGAGIAMDKAIDKATLEGLSTQRAKLLGLEVYQSPKGTGLKVGTLRDTGTAKAVTKLKFPIFKTGEKTFALGGAGKGTETITYYSELTKGTKIITKSIHFGGRGTITPSAFLKMGDVKFDLSKIKGSGAYGSGYYGEVGKDTIRTFRFTGASIDRGKYYAVTGGTPRKLLFGIKEVKSLGDLSYAGRIYKFKPGIEVTKMGDEGHSFIAGSGRKSSKQFFEQLSLQEVAIGGGVSGSISKEVVQDVAMTIKVTTPLTTITSMTTPIIKSDLKLKTITKTPSPLKQPVLTKMESKVDLVAKPKFYGGLVAIHPPTLLFKQNLSYSPALKLKTELKSQARLKSAPVLVAPTTTLGVGSPTPLPIKVIPPIAFPIIPSFGYPKVGKNIRAGKQEGYITSFAGWAGGIRGAKAKPGKFGFTGFEIRPLTLKGKVMFESKTSKVTPKLKTKYKKVISKKKVVRKKKKSSARKKKRKN